MTYDISRRAVLTGGLGVALGDDAPGAGAASAFEVLLRQESGN